MSMNWAVVWVRLAVLVASLGGLVGALSSHAQASEVAPDRSASALPHSAIPRIRDLDRPSTTVKEWVMQVEAATTQITAVKLERTEDGLDIVLETADGKPLQIDATKFRREGTSLIAEIPNVVLALPEGQTFAAENPTEDIAIVQVVQEGSIVRVSVAGKEALPKTEVTLKTGGLAYGLNLAEDTADDEIVVTGEGQDGYRVPNASTATRTDTPIRDIPQSIQVVPQEVLRDQQAFRLDDALRNVPGVSPNFGSSSINTFRIRGFEANSYLRDGLPDPIAATGALTELPSIEQVEVLKGPASVLFGFGNPGGTINLVTKAPLRQPFYGIEAAIGNYNSYRGTIELSGPLNRSQTILYRLNTAYSKSDSFVDFVDSSNFSIVPVLQIVIGDRTNLILEGEYSYDRGSYASGVPVIGSILANPNGKVSRNANFGEPGEGNTESLLRIGYRLEHEFNDNLRLRSAFRASFLSYEDKVTIPTRLRSDNRTFNRFYREYEIEQSNYFLTNNLIGKFSTGSIQHQLLFGVDLSRYSFRTPRYVDFAAAPIDIFNPIYRQPLGEITTPDYRELIQTDSLGIYLQNQVTLLDNLKLLLGVRFDSFEQNYEFFTDNTQTSQSGSAFSPRFGIVYQPIPAISLYASYTTSFAPARGLVFFSNFDRPLEPGRGRQFEVGVKADLSNRLSTTLALYELTRTNVLVDDPNNPGFSIQTGEQQSKGIELSLAGEILPGWNIFAGYAYTDARITKDTTLAVGNRLNNTPNHSFNLWASYQIQTGNLRGLGFGLGLFLALLHD